MQYLTYEEYSEIGGTLDLAAFNRSVDRACGIIDMYTRNRLRRATTVSHRVKAGVRALVDFLDAHNSGGVAVTSRSQSAGGVSESENYATKTLGDVNDEAFGIVYDYLVMETDDCGTPLLYRGAMR